MLTGSALAVGLLSAPAHADGPADQISGVVGGLLGDLIGGSSEEPAPSAKRSDYGRTSAPDGVLRKGCHNYRYHYRVTPPSNDWALETYLVDRTGEGVASGSFDVDSDPAANSPRFRFCRHATTPGRFTIKAKLHWYGDYGDEHKIWLEPSHFRLRAHR